MTKVKRSQFRTFLNITPESPHILGSLTATYFLLGQGVTTGEVNMNPKTTDEQYIGEDSATSTVDSYGPTMPVKQTAFSDDDVFNFVDQLRLDRAILGDAETDVVNVWTYEAGTPPSYPAEQQKVAIAVDDIGDAAGVPVELNYTINYIGTPVVGTFNVTTKVFTAS